MMKNNVVELIIENMILTWELNDEKRVRHSGLRNDRNTIFEARSL